MQVTDLYITYNIIYYIKRARQLTFEYRAAVLMFNNQRHDCECDNTFHSSVNNTWMLRNLHVRHSIPSYCVYSVSPHKIVPNGVKAESTTAAFPISTE